MTIYGVKKIEDGITLRNGRFTVDTVIDEKRIRRAVKANTLEAARRMRDNLIQLSLGQVSEKDARTLFFSYDKSWIDIVESLKKSGFLRKKYLDIKRGAANRGIVFTLTENELETVIRLSNGRCALTGIPLELATAARHPFKLSIDRIDAKGPYRFDNLRVVCFSVNVAIGEWGEQVLEAISIGYAHQRLLSTCTKMVTGEIINKSCDQSCDAAG